MANACNTRHGYGHGEVEQLKNTLRLGFSLLFVSSMVRSLHPLSLISQSDTNFCDSPWQTEFRISLLASALITHIHSENWQVVVVAAFDWAQKKENGVVDAFAISTSVRQWTAGAGVRRHLTIGTAITPYVHTLSGIARSSVRGSSNGTDCDPQIFGPAPKCGGNSTTARGARTVVALHR